MSTLPSIVFQKGQGGLGRPLPGQDYVSGMLIYAANGDLPSGFSTSARNKVLYALSDAEAAGILNDYSTGTGATGVYTVSAVGANGDTLQLLVADIDANGNAQSTNLGTYTKVSADTTLTLVAASIAAMINLNTIYHGYTATSLVGAVSIVAPKKLGVYLNSGTPLSAVIVGTIAGSVTTPFASGAYSKLAIWHYHISEFFRMQPGGVLFVGFYAIPSPYTFVEITSLQNFAVGAIRQMGIVKDPASAYSTGDITAINTICLANDVIYKPLSAIYSADLIATTDISTLTDLSALTANKVSDVIAMDGGGQGWFLYLTTGKSIPALGTILGTVALAKVSEDIAWVGSFNISNGAECEVLAFANGQKFTDAAITENLLEALNVKRHVFLKKFVGLSGSYWNDSHTAIAVTSDYAYIENNRTIDKAIRGLYVALLPSLNSPLQLNADGTLSETTVAYLESQADVSLDQMVRDGELSAKAVTINPAQNVLSTSKIIIAVVLVINGVARTIVVPIGFKPKIS